jgi:rare lipoprotein A
LDEGVREEDDFGNGGYLMQARMARWLMLALFIGLGAAQGPTSSGSAKASVINVQALNPTAGASTRSAAPYQVGTASWYGDYFEGKPTASGEPFNMYDLTAAHLSLPLGTYVRVTNLRNRRSVIVRINDRGPYVAGRIVDLSYYAAKVLKFDQQGLQRVRLDVIHPRHPAPTTLALLREPVQR